MMAAKKLDGAVDRTNVAVLLVGEDGIVSYANAAAHELLGYPHNGLEGLTLEWLCPPTRHPELQNVRAVLQGQTGRRIRSAAMRADGSVVQVAMSIEPCLNAEGQIVAASIRYDELPSSRPPKSPSEQNERTPATISGVHSAVQSPLREEPLLERSPRSLEHVQTAMQLLGWLEQRLSAPASGHPADEARERARMLLVLDEARASLADHARSLQEHEAKK